MVLDEECNKLLNKTLIMNEDLREFKRRSFDWKIERFNDLKRSRELFHDNCIIKEPDNDYSVHHMGQFDLAMCKIVISLFAENDETKLERSQEMKSMLDYFTNEEIESVKALDKYSMIENISPDAIANAIFSKSGEIYTIIKEWYSTQTERYTNLFNRAYEEQGNYLVEVIKERYLNRFRRIGEGIAEYIKKYPNAGGKIFEDFGDALSRFSSSHQNYNSNIHEIEMLFDSATESNISDTIKKIETKLEPLKTILDNVVISYKEEEDPRMRSVLDLQKETLSMNIAKIEKNLDSLKERLAIANIKKIPHSKEEFVKSISGVKSDFIDSSELRFFNRFKNNMEALMSASKRNVLKNHRNEEIIINGKKNISFSEFNFNLDRNEEDDVSINVSLEAYHFYNKHLLRDDSEITFTALYFKPFNEVEKHAEVHHPMNIQDFVSLYMRLRDQRTDSEIIGLASPTGFTEELLDFLVPENGQGGFSDTNVSFILINLNSNETIHKSLDILSQEYYGIFAFETYQDKLAALRIMIDALSEESSPCHILEISNRMHSSPNDIYKLLINLEEVGYGDIIYPNKSKVVDVESVMFQKRKVAGGR